MVKAGRQKIQQKRSGAAILGSAHQTRAQTSTARCFADDNRIILANHRALRYEQRQRSVYVPIPPWQWLPRHEGAGIFAGARTNHRATYVKPHYSISRRNQQQRPGNVPRAGRSYRQSVSRLFIPFSLHLCGCSKKNGGGPTEHPHHPGERAGPGN